MGEKQQPHTMCAAGRTATLLSCRPTWNAPQGAALQAAAVPKALAGGRKRWRAERFFFVDPWGNTLKNVAKCTETVEVEQAVQG